MCRLAIICLMLLASCGRDPPALALLDLSDCPGWTGGPPTSERTFARAASAEQAGRLCANSKLGAVRDAIKE